MTDWILIAAAKSLFAAFDELAPDRDHASDGSIGDAAHQREVSDHNPDETGAVPIHDADHINEVHAIDVDSDLRVPGLSMETVVQFILGRCRSGAEKRLRYLIYNRRIWEADNGWKQRAYTGASAHTEHAHFSFSYVSSLEASTVSWHFEEIPIMLTPDDKAWIHSEIRAVYSTAEKQADGTPSVPAGALFFQGIPNGTRPADPAHGLAHERTTAWELLEDLGAAIVELQQQVAALAAKLGA